MKKYNDYIRTVTRYLSRNDELGTYLKNLEAEKAVREEMLKTIMHPITAQYSLIAGCSKGNNESKVEQETERREKLQHEMSSSISTLPRFGRTWIGWTEQCSSLMPSRRFMILLINWVKNT